MSTRPLLLEARYLWEQLAREPGSFPPMDGMNVIVSPESGLCPAGWIGVVALGGSALVTAPDESTAATVRTALAGLPAAALVDAAAVREVLPVAGVLGPAALAYLTPEGFRPAGGPSAVERLPGGHPALRALEEAAGEEDSSEASLDEITSRAFVVREHGRVVAAAGYRAWPRRTAHISVLTAPEARGRGLARTAASAAVADALATGLLPQWRARPPASRRVAAALGFEELGAQLSLEPAPDGPAPRPLATLLP
ncbi:GNAT family N-acetyltransferase [Streptomyces sp. TLI_105]|uniref:GNAT family N-acetyltransferase n=1 Tax=Streptomyces sp. TLI_105 TaxID=1881019 RepID=UPI000896EA5A|nr:GNAT family N-acetyltransferase [Streptomyces sp. TLI_105]SED82252.1 GNAT acetyltransferase [Streptomyces sp. TLI_105]